MASSEGVVPPGNNLEDIQIDTNLKLPATATSEIKWGGNLKSNSDITRTETVVTRGNIKSSDTSDTVIENIVYNEYGEAFTLKQTYHPTSTANEYEVSWEVFDADDSSVGDSGGVAMTLQFVDDGNGNFVLDAASKALFSASSTDNDVDLTAVGTPSGDIDFDIDASSLTNNDTTKTISSSADQNREPNVVSGSVTVYDSLGTAHQVTLQFTKINANEWRFVASIPAASTSTGTAEYSTGTIEFNSDGTLDSSKISPNNPFLSFTPAAGADPVVMNLDFGEGFNGITQTSSSSVVSATSQNGSASATLSDVNIDQYGNIMGVFSNGNSRVLAQIMVATFNNLNGLISEGGNLYTAYANSGDPFVGALGEETNTTVQSGALEQSNVDLSEEFTKMIVSQRGFQANSRVITTADSLLQEITNLIR
jgi:flagellar hook protein FlgE